MIFALQGDKIKTFPDGPYNIGLESDYIFVLSDGSHDYVSVDASNFIQSAGTTQVNTSSNILDVWLAMVPKPSNGEPVFFITTYCQDGSTPGVAYYRNGGMDNYTNVYEYINARSMSIPTFVKAARADWENQSDEMNVGNKRYFNCASNATQMENFNDTSRISIYFTITNSARTLNIHSTTGTVSTHYVRTNFTWADESQMADTLRRISNDESRITGTENNILSLSERIDALELDVERVLGVVNNKFVSR